MDVLNKLEKIDEKLEKMDDKLGNIDVTLVAQAADLKYHIKRTTLAEKRMEHIESQLEPIKKHVSMVHGAFKVIGVAASALAGAAGLAKLFF